MKKITLGIVLGVAVLVLAGCGNKAVTTSESSQNDQTKSEQAAENDMATKMPEATGDVDQTVDAIVSGAETEGTAALSTDTDAVAAIGDDQDTNNLNKTYDENAL